MNITHIRTVDAPERVLCTLSPTGSSVSLQIMQMIWREEVREFPDCVSICEVCTEIGKTLPKACWVCKGLGFIPVKVDVESNGINYVQDCPVCRKKNL